MTKTPKESYYDSEHDALYNTILNNRIHREHRQSRLRVSGDILITAVLATALLGILGWIVYGLIVGN